MTGSRPGTRSRRRPGACRRPCARTVRPNPQRAPNGGRRGPPLVHGHEEHLVLALDVHLRVIVIGALQIIVAEEPEAGAPRGPALRVAVVVVADGLAVPAYRRIEADERDSLSRPESLVSKPIYYFELAKIRLKYILKTGQL